MLGSVKLFSRFSSLSLLISLLKSSNRTDLQIREIPENAHKIMHIIAKDELYNIDQRLNC